MNKESAVGVRLNKQEREWLEDRVKEGKFASLSHGLRFALKELMEKEKENQESL